MKPPKAPLDPAKRAQIQAELHRDLVADRGIERVVTDDVRGEPDRRVLGQQAGQLDDAAHAGRELRCELVAVIGQPEHAEQFADPASGALLQFSYLGIYVLFGDLQPTLL